MHHPWPNPCPWNILLTLLWVKHSLCWVMLKLFKGAIIFRLWYSNKRDKIVFSKNRVQKKMSHLRPPTREHVAWGIRVRNENNVQQKLWTGFVEWVKQAFFYFKSVKELDDMYEFLFIIILSMILRRRCYLPFICELKN